MIEFIGTDLDGTLLNSYSKISSENIQAIRKVVNSGVAFAICSGRTLHSVNKFFEKDLKIAELYLKLSKAEGKLTRYMNHVKMNLDREL